MKKLSFHDLFHDLKGAQKKTYEKGSVLFRQGESSDHIFYVEKGELKLVRYTTDGHSVTLHTAFDGDSFAEAALFTEAYHCNGEVVQDSIIWCYPRLEVLAKMGSDKSCMQRLYHLLAGQVRHLRFMLELRGVQSAQERVLQYFLMMAGPDGKVQLRDTLMDTAKELGMAHETFYRTVKKLEKNGTLARTDKKTFQLNKHI